MKTIKKKSYPCPMCEKEFDKALAFAGHLRTHVRKGEIKKEPAEKPVKVYEAEGINPNIIPWANDIKEKIIESKYVIYPALKDILEEQETKEDIGLGECQLGDKKWAIERWKVNLMGRTIEIDVCREHGHLIREAFRRLKRITNESATQIMNPKIHDELKEKSQRRALEPRAREKEATA